MQCGAMSGSVTLLQWGSALMSIAPETIKGHANARDQCHHSAPCRCPRTMLPLRLCQYKKSLLPPETVVISRPHEQVIGPAAAQVLWWRLCPVLDRESLESCCSEPAPPFRGNGIKGPVPHWVLQQESWSYLSGKSWSLQPEKMAPPFTIGYAPYLPSTLELTLVGDTGEPTLRVWEQQGWPCSSLSAMQWHREGKDALPTLPYATCGRRK